MKNYELWYEKEAPFGYENIACFEPENIPDKGWENWSLPLGNGYMGVNVFGRTPAERWNCIYNLSGEWGGLHPAALYQLSR